MYICSLCSYGSKVKVGKCPDCGEFGTMIQDFSLTSVSKSAKLTAGKIQSLKSPSHHQETKQLNYNLTNPEVRSVLGDFIVQAGVYLLAGEPGMGKSTLALQLIHDLVKQKSDLNWAYYTGEETAEQVMTRWNRLYPDQSQDRFFYSSSCDAIIETIQEHQQQLVIIDSIQTIKTIHNDASPGSPAQVRTCSEMLTDIAKQYGVSMIIIGHVTKGGEIAGPKYLEHIVDVVLYLEGDRTGDMRFLRNYKNRFGNADGTGIFGMTHNGLQPIYEPEKLLVGQSSLPGIAWSIGLDNGRAVLVWVETLLTKSYGKFPERHYVGVSNKRVDMIIAILEKYLNCKLAQYNIFVNIPGEFHLNDSGLDLAIAMAIYSGYKNQPLPDKTVYIGELGLTGRISKTKSHEKRRSETPKKWSVLDYELESSIAKLV